MVECSNDKIISQVLKAVSDTTDKLVFTWESQYSVDDNSTVTLNFTEIDDNKTNFHCLMSSLSLKKHAPAMKKAGVIFLIN
jgi:uncharacterized protein YndB with AHSA1/START domain